MKDLIPFNRRNHLSKKDGFEDFYNVLDDFFTNPLTRSRSLMNDTFKLDIKDEEDKYVIEADLPGVKKEEIDLDLRDGRLTISIEREEEKEEKEKDYLYRERRYSSMSRSLYLGDIKQEDISAKLEDGVLFIEVPKDEEKEKTQKIPIE